MKTPKRTDYCISIPEDRGKKYEIFRYPAGEAQVRLLEPEIAKVQAADCIKVTANIRDGEIMELALLTSALGLIAGSTYNQLILPYLPYARADRAFTNGDCEGLRAFATLINALGYDHIITWDAHSPVAEKLIRRLIVLSSGELIAKAIKKIGRKDLLILLPDKGATRYESIILNLGLPFIYGEKVRDAKTGKLSGFHIPAFTQAYKKILIVDDICDGGGTFVGLGAELLHEAFNTEHPFIPDLFLFVTHGIFSKGLKELAGYFKKIYTSDSYDAFGGELTLYKTVQKDYNLVEVLKYS